MRVQREGGFLNTKGNQMERSAGLLEHVRSRLDSDANFHQCAGSCCDLDEGQCRTRLGSFRSRYGHFPCTVRVRAGIFHPMTGMCNGNDRSDCRGITHHDIQQKQSGKCEKQKFPKHVPLCCSSCPFFTYGILSRFGQALIQTSFRLMSSSLM